MSPPKSQLKQLKEQIAAQERELDSLREILNDKSKQAESSLLQIEDLRQQLKMQESERDLH